ncbi:hypothetical protein [Anaerococcus rubeinfantis]|uniref:hypothetical protein n=1 Tax=Anaerococcus rubeinfantis TaxID=1720199 RepID=UPI000AE8E070|nr:hypothetical protein [Anaerococcus rubeinfantis]
MDDLTQIYIDRLAESNHNGILLKVENRNLKRRINELESELKELKGDDEKTDTQEK